MDLGLTGKRAIVTAASAGLGFAAAEALAAEGAKVAICSRDLERARGAAQRIERQHDGAAVTALAADVANAKELERFFGEAIESLGGLDILVCNAGGPPVGSFKSLSEEQWHVAYNLTLQSVARSVRLALPHFEKAGGGRVLALASSSVKRSLPNLLLSNVFRPAVHGLCRSLAMELASDNIQVNCLAPGRIATERTEQLDRANAEKTGVSFEEIRARSVAQIPMGRFGTPEEFGRVAAFLCSPAAIYISGSTIFVDGAAVNCL